MAAPLGFKDFTTGEVLTAGDVDGYLMQGIWVFASAAARDAAVTSPQEGNACYLKDTDVIQIYTGSTWATQSASNPISANIIDAKGDLIAGTAADTVSRLAVGANGTVLTADSAEATGLKWAAASGGGTYSAYTPTFTNLTVGNGTLVARYTNVGKFVHGYMSLVLGSTSSVGTGARFSLPSTPKTGGILNYGFGTYEDTGTASVAAYVTNNSNTLELRATYNVSGYLGSLNSTTPFTWTTNDAIAIQFVYEEN
jgi:hypothetical protein